MLKGNLADFPLVGLLQMLFASGRGGALIIEPPPLSGNIYIYAGQIIHAQAGGLTGNRALTLLAGLRRASFRFEAESLPPMATIESGRFQTQARLAEEVQIWQGLRHLPEDWTQGLRIDPKAHQQDLTPQDLLLLQQLDGRRIVEVLTSFEAGPLEAAQTLERLFAAGWLSSKPQLLIGPALLVVLPLYGNEQGVAYVDEALYLQWSRQIKQSFLLRVGLRSGAEDVILTPRPRPNFQSRLGLFEKDLRRYRLARGTQVEAWPELE
ncbi:MULTISPECIES: DUF4388 domain-containing protein [unclassified Meiothermus]|uniref:DUF4388 domain-containing protein n=1 Tax=unclassified Meiothermus TaxID=370471 RepID=UPI000D7C0F57|nr:MULTISPECIES: DUF4388 domain-containing protein [unclassified Meiothermus]PZA06699.1 hypothetical protein DNA98_11945 [Meiothermus sp. Pnk-1]RYM36625.1 DUF4388 domain-containing protein [Meiothermus sp. PNK-Is4]